MNSSQDHKNPWQLPHNEQALESALSQIFSSYAKIVLDFGRAYPGDLTSETFLESYLEEAKWLFQLMDNISQRTEGVSIEARFSDGRTKELFKSSISLSWNLWEDGTTLSFYDEKNREKNLKVLSLFDLLTLTQGSRFSREAIESGKDQLILPLCLWGDVEQIGHHYVDYEQTFAEVFEFIGNAGPRPQVVFVDGPLGQAYLWQELKSMKVRELFQPIRTLHFFKDSKVNGLLKVWNEYFREDSCHKCLPCVFSRQGMKEDKSLEDLKGLSAFQCHFPSLYRKADSFSKTLEDPQIKTLGGNG